MTTAPSVNSGIGKPLVDDPENFRPIDWDLDVSEPDV